MIVEQKRNKDIFDVAFQEDGQLNWKSKLRNEDHDFVNDGANVALEGENHKSFTKEEQIPEDYRWLKQN